METSAASQIREIEAKLTEIVEELTDLPASPRRRKLLRRAQKLDDLLLEWK